MGAQEARLDLQVEGIVCTGCAVDMETVLGDTDGILEVSVSYADGTVAVVYDPDEIAPETIIAKINGFGMKTQLADRS